MFSKNCFKGIYSQINKHKLLISKWTSQISLGNDDKYIILKNVTRNRNNGTLPTTRQYTIKASNNEPLPTFCSKKLSTSDLILFHHKINSNTTRHIFQKQFCSYSQSNQVIEKLYYVDNEENRETSKLYPSPKNVLHNVFSLVAQETKDKSYQLKPTFKSVQDKRSSNWICTYNLTWPVEIKFLAKDTKKSTASHKAALAALSWLRNRNKITKNGSPIIYERNEIKQLVTKSIPNIYLDEKSMDIMENIINIYQEKMVPIVTKSVEASREILGSKLLVKQEHELKLNSPIKKFLGLDRYKAKEKIVLPITAYKEQFIELLQKNQVLIVKGEPGCGKSTRIPQYVLEAWAREDGLLGKPGLIAVTQPRRIAAISLANRVCNERNESTGYVVGHQVRLNSKFHAATGRILYCTTGILLRHVQSDSTLSEFSHIILDEAHERDVNTDVLMNLLKITVKKNPNLKVIVMSATIDTDMFRKYYNNAPVIEIPGFTYPVKRLFLDSCKHLDLNKTENMCEGQFPGVIHDDVAKVIQFIHRNKPEGAILCFLPGWEDISKIQKLIPQRADIVVYCLHSRLNDSEQQKIFTNPPPGVRKVILATNIAETSVTIDDVVYVIDTGVHKEQRFDTEKGIKCIDNHWISKASATQRSGRAGRVQPGECFHLYSESKHRSFDEYSLPEIMRTSLTKIVLDSKAFSNNMNTFEFMKNLPTPPEEDAIARAVEELKDLELLDDKDNITTLGSTLAQFQLEPKLSKTLVSSYVFSCLTPVIDIVTMFSTDTELFLSGLIDKRAAKEIKSQFSEDSDHLAMMRIFEKYMDLNDENDNFRLKEFCEELNLVPHKMGTLKKLRDIHFGYLEDGLHQVLPISDKYSDNDEFVKAILYFGIGNILYNRNWDLVKNRLKSNTNVLLTGNNHKATITPESVNYRRNKFPSDYLLYINETRSNIRRTTLIRECSFLSNLSVLLFSNKNLEITKIPNMADLNGNEGVNKVKIFLKDTPIQLICEKSKQK